MPAAEMLYCPMCPREWNATADHHDRTCPECGRRGGMMPADTDALAADLGALRNVVAGVITGDGGPDRLRVTIRHDEWRTTNLFPSQYERIQTVIGDDAWRISEFTIRQKPREEMDDEDADSDFVFSILELEPAEVDGEVADPEGVTA